MNRWIILIASCCMILGLTKIVPTTLQNLSGSNIAITLLLLIFVVLGLTMFYKSFPKSSKFEQEMIPVND